MSAQNASTVVVTTCRPGCCLIALSRIRPILSHHPSCPRILYRERVLPYMRFAEDFLNVLMSGGSGFVGTALTQSLRANGHTVAHLVRPGSPARPGDVRWNPNS